MKTLVIGDSCQDIFIYGKCDRLCPEAPVPVFIPQKTKKMGGMARNVYENLRSLDMEVDLITNDEQITKTRYVDEKTNQIIIRVDSEKNSISKIKNLYDIEFSKYDAIIISDYNKGFLDYEDIQYICEKHKLVFIDTKKIINEYFYKCRFIKINEIEYDNNLTFSEILKNEFKEKLIITKGAKGAEYNNKIFSVNRVEIKDMVGAGDTFIASLVFKFLETNNIYESIKFANECSTIVVQHRGVTVVGDLIKKLKK